MIMLSEQLMKPLSVSTICGYGTRIVRNIRKMLKVVIDDFVCKWSVLCMFHNWRFDIESLFQIYMYCMYMYTITL
jgi:hypothetical protein